MEHKYNNFFYPNVCHICKKFSNDASLKRCGNCKMVAYCSKEHQKQHWVEHKEVCNAICNVLRTTKISIFLNSKQNLDVEKWTEIKMTFMVMTAMKIGRKLVHYEEEMFKFLRSCIICRNRNAKVLEDCPNCPNISFCMEHKEQGMHHKFCDLTQLCFSLDMSSLTHNRKIPKMKVPQHKSIVCLPQNIKDFIEQYIEPQSDPQLSAKENAIINSEYLTRPLTFLHSIQKLEDLSEIKNITVHIVAANLVDIIGVVLWEILLHWLPCLTTLNIFLIGPELFPDSLSVNLCNNCKNCNKQLFIQTFDMLYETYVKIESYVKPNFVIGYNAGIHEYEDYDSEYYTWKQSLQLIAEQHCPFIVTCYTHSEAEKEELRLKEILGDQINHTYFEQNPFSSIRPYRDFETEGIYYQNQYTIIYKNLKASQ